MKITKSQLKHIIKEELESAIEEGFFDKVKQTIGVGPSANQLVYKFRDELERVLRSHVGFRAIAAGKRWHQIAPRIDEEPPAQAGNRGSLTSAARSHMNRAAEQFHSGLGEFFVELGVLSDTSNDLSNAIRDMRSGRLSFDRSLKRALSGLIDDIVQHADEDAIYDTIPMLMDILANDNLRVTYSPAVWASQNEEKLDTYYGQEAGIAAAKRKAAASASDTPEKRRRAARSGRTYMENKD